MLSCCAYILLVGATYFSSLCDGFFWDTIQLGSKHAHHYYSSGFTSWLLPDEIDSGHIPWFGYYLAACWVIFDNSLLVSHLAMAPFVIGSVYYIRRVAEYFIHDWKDTLTLFVVMQGTLLAQISLVSPDVVLVCALFMAIDALIRGRRHSYALALMLLTLVSMRGMMAAAILGVYDLWHYARLAGWLSWPHFVRYRIWSYLPAGCLFIMYNAYHLAAKGWIGFHSDSPWSSSFDSVSWQGIVYNVGLLGWRLLDFGALASYAVGAYLLIAFGRRLWRDRSYRLLLGLLIAFAVLLPLSMVWARYLIGHRYLLPIMLLVNMVVGYGLLVVPMSKGRRWMIAGGWLVITLTGHLWIYPPSIAQGWDASLAYRPYIELREQAISFMDQHGIDIEETGTFFPNINRIEHIDLNDDTRMFKDFEEEDTRYVLYSNVYNVSDDDYDRLQSAVDTIQTWRRGGVQVLLLSYPATQPSK